MNPPDINAWIAEVKSGPSADGIGMILTHRGIVRGHSRSGEAVTSMDMTFDRTRMETAVAEALTWDGVIAVRAWINEGRLAVGDDIMQVLVAGDIREHVFDALSGLVRILKTEVVAETELR